MPHSDNHTSRWRRIASLIVDGAIMIGKWKWARHEQGQSTVEFALVVIVCLALLIGVIDLARAAYLKNRLDSGAADLARNLAAISGTTTSGSQYIWTPPPLDPTSSGATIPTLYQGNKTSVQQAIQASLVHASGVAGNAFSTVQLAPTGGSFSSSTTTISNSQVTVEGSPNLTDPQVITVIVSTPFTPIVGQFLSSGTITLQSQVSVIPVQGLTAGY
jgi:Flp pilus assembly protein TadG